MDIKLKEIERQESIKSLDNINKSFGNDLPKISISTSQSSNSTRYDSYSRKIPKRVTFNRNVTVVNIQSYKKYLRKPNHQTISSGFEEDFEDHNHNCVNCEIF